ncbi:Zinc finger protein [Trichuris trichiura]|uniref:Zinc finger protein n=1 Tax=Trichuris trichiura TaxID=36087 RepID=A0A077YX11_TRITR|nr:Zinc finger protein [Trichuris trichiura]
MNTIVFYPYLCIFPTVQLRCRGWQLTILILIFTSSQRYVDINQRRGRQVAVKEHCCLYDPAALKKQRVAYTLSHLSASDFVGYILIYKSSKCNDMLQHGYCPRSSFCAFAHTDAGSFSSPSDSGFTSCGELAKAQSGTSRLSASYADSVAEGNVLRAVRTPGTAEAPQRRYTMPTPRSIAGKAESQPEAAYSYPKAPGFERGYHSPYRERACSTLLPSNNDKVNKSSIFGYYDPTVYDSGSISSAHSLVSDYYSSSLRAACNKYEPVENLNALIGSLADDLNMDDVVLPTINESEERHADAPISFGATATYDSHLSVASSAASVKTAERCPQGYSPVGGSCHGTLSASSNGYFNFGEDNLLVKMQQTAAVGQHSAGPGGYRDSADVFTPLSPCTVTQASRVEVMPFCEGAMPVGATSRFGGMDLDECLLRTTKTCEVWKREAEEQRRRALIAEQEKLQAISERDDAFRQLACMQLEMQLIKAGNLPTSSTSADSMNAYQLEELKNRLQVELEKLQHNAGPMCARCGRHVNDRLPSVHCPVCTPSCKVGAGSPAMA